VLIKEIDQQDDNAQDVSTALDAHRREALLLTGLVHPNLPRVYDFFVEGGRDYFVMDFLDGETLEEYLSKSTDGWLPADEVLAIGIQLSSVLDYLQMRQLPLGFKDLSLNNILRTPDAPDGRYIASASSDGTVQIWEAMTGRLVFTYRGHLGAVNTVSWSSNGNSIATGGEDQTVQVWSVQQALHSGRVDERSSQSSLRPIVTYKGHSGPINNLAWSPDGQYIASASDDVTVQLWHSLTGDHIFTYKGHTQGQSSHGLTLPVPGRAGGSWFVQAACCCPWLSQQ
jgi:WD40 repeat protein